MQVSHCTLADEVHNRQISSLAHVPVECIQLPLRGAGVRPQPVLDVDAPVDDLRAGEMRCEALAGACADGAVGGTEVAGWFIYV